MAEPVLRLEQVIKDYGDRVVTRVLHGVNLSVLPGEFTALIGPSGSGKSTLLNLIGLLDRPSDGHIWIEGVETSTLDDDTLTEFRGRRIGFIFQFHYLLPELTSHENVMVPMWTDRGRLNNEIRERALTLLEQVGLQDHAHKRVTDLSGGQQQRVAIARSLSMRPRIVLADEPTGNLDTKSADQVFELLREVNRSQGTAFMVVTHDPRLARRCDRIVEIVDGRIVSDEPNVRSS
jgi:lipoprotein-releasing system ATP-binding protein